MAAGREAGYFTIARIRRTRGRRGEVAAEVLTDFPDRFQAGQELLLSKDDLLQEKVLEESWFHKDLAILKFRGVDSIAAAEALVGCWVQLPKRERRPLPLGSVYISDLIGCTVREGHQSLGKVESWEETGGVPLLKVRTEQGELLIPFAEEICQSVDTEKKEIRVRLPEGLQELNWRKVSSSREAQNDSSRNDD